MRYVFYAIALFIVIALNAFAVTVYAISNPEPEHFEYTPTPRAYLAKLCTQPDCDFAFLDTVAWCESKWQMVGNSTSSAYGYFQIIKGTEETTKVYKNGGSRMDPYDNVEMGVELYRRDGIFPWIPSRACWHWRYQGALNLNENACLGAVCEYYEEEKGA